MKSIMKFGVSCVMLLALTGCVWDQAVVDSRVAEVQKITQAVCKFVPTASSVASMLAADPATVVGVTAIAAAICNAVDKLAAPFGPTEECGFGKVNDVCIEGERVS